MIQNIIFFLNKKREKKGNIGTKNAIGLEYIKKI